MLENIINLALALIGAFIVISLLDVITSGNRRKEEKRDIVHQDTEKKHSN